MSASPSLCCVPGCVNGEEQENARDQVTFFKFPRQDAALRRLWLEKLKAPDWNPGRKKRICSNHFEEDCFTKKSHGGIELKKDAVPTVFCRVETVEQHDIFSDYCHDELGLLKTVSDFRTRYQVFEEGRLYKITSVIDKDLALREQIMRKTIPDHPNILKVTKYAMNEKCFLLQFQQFGSNVRTLAEFLSDLPTHDDSRNTRASLARQLLSGVKHLHHNMLLHSHLDASSVFVGEIDGLSILKIAEFAFSNHVEKLLEDDDLCTPPQIRGASTLAVDILAVGRLLRLILFGNLEDQKTSHTTNLSEEDKELMRLTQEMMGVPKQRPSINDVIEKCEELLPATEQKNQQTEEESMNKSKCAAPQVEENLSECNKVVSTKRKVAKAERQAYDKRIHLYTVMLFVMFALKKDFEFNLSTDLEQVGKFGDIKFSFIDEEKSWNNIYIQLKYVHRKQKEISISEFLPNLKPIRGKQNTNSISNIAFKDLIKATENLACSNGTCKNHFMLLTNQKLSYNEKEFDPNFKSKMFKTKDLASIEIIPSLQFKEKFLGRNELIKNIHRSGIKDHQIEEFFKHFSIATELSDDITMEQNVMEDIQTLVGGDGNVAQQIFLVLQHWLTCWIQDENAVILNKQNVRELVENITRSVKSDLSIIPKKEIQFYNRVEEQKEICQLLLKSTGKPIDLVVTGIPGVGKTKLVQECVKKNKNRFNRTFLIPAFSKQILLRSFAIIYQILFNRDGIGEFVLKIILHDLYKVLNKERCIIIFDNVINKEDILELLPSKILKEKSTIFIVVTTSSETEWDCGLRLKIKKFTLEESENFLKSGINGQLKGPSEEKLLRELAEKLDNLPRSLNQAVNIIRENDLSVSEFMSGLQQPQLDDKKFEEEEKKDVEKVWREALEDNRAAQKIAV